MRTKKYARGGIWEFNEWAILIDCIHEEDCYSNAKTGEKWLHCFKPCKHAILIKKEEKKGKNIYDESWIDRTLFFKIPRVVVATNEGGYNTTGVCLDCILERAKNL
jgi:hypothetical protein